MITQSHVAVGHATSPTLVVEVFRFRWMVSWCRKVVADQRAHGVDGLLNETDPSDEHADGYCRTHKERSATAGYPAGALREKECPSDTLGRPRSSGCPSTGLNRVSFAARASQSHTCTRQRAQSVPRLRWTWFTTRRPRTTLVRYGGGFAGALLTARLVNSTPRRTSTRLPGTRLAVDFREQAAMGIPTARGCCEGPVLSHGATMPRTSVG